MNPQTLEDYVFLARIAEQAERYQEMVDYMKKVATTPKPNQSAVKLTVDERNLLSVAYKNTVGSRRASWRVLSNLEHKEEARGSDEKVARIKKFRLIIEGELNDVCQDVLKVLEETLIKDSADLEDRVFYLKMAGDYYRYLAEFLAGESKKEVAERAKKSYEKAMKEAKEGINGSAPLEPTSPILLGLALNYSVFYYEILNGPNEACKMARTAFDEAVAQLDHLPEEDYKDATLILQLLRDNLTLWTSTDDDEAGVENDVDVTDT